MSSAKSNNDVNELQYIKGVGPKRAEAFINSGISSARDLLFYIPRTYVTLQRVPTLAALRVKLQRENALFEKEFQLRQ